MKDELKATIKRLSEIVLFVFAGAVVFYELTNDLISTVIFVVTVVWVLFVVYVIFPILSEI